MKRPFRFGALVTRAQQGTDWLDRARAIEQLGYDTLLLNDHVAYQRSLSPVVALAAAAAVTSTLRLGTMVLCNDFRHPAILAKDLATLDALSEGRVEPGIGAGWLLADYEALGIPYRPIGVRRQRMEEAVAIIRASFAGDSLNHKGDHYEISDLRPSPTTVQGAGVRILVGAGGPRMLATAGRVADIVNVSFDMAAGSTANEAAYHGSFDLTMERAAAVQEAARRAGRDVELGLTVHLGAITDAVDTTAAQFAKRLGLTPAQIIDSPYYVLGSVAQIAEQLERLRAEGGFSYISFGDTLQANLPDTMAPVVALLDGR